MKVKMERLGCFIWIIIFFFSCNSDSKLPEHPNILFISLEDLSTRLGCYGDTLVKSPNIDRFAGESVLFADVHCQVALCTPSRTSILTGIRPSTSGMVKIDDDWKAILPNAVSLPRQLKDHGYFTYRVGKISDPRSGGSDQAWSISAEEWGVETNDLPLKAMEQVFAQEKPFFLAIGYKQTHDPWDPSAGAMAEYDWQHVNIHGQGRTFKGKTISDEQARQLAHRYFADITGVDSLVGDLINKIKATPFYENTIILLGVMDHGYSLGHHNKWGKGDLYDDQTQVPLLIRVPGNKNNGQRTTGIVELVDIYPTLLEYCNLPEPPQQLEGISLKNLLENPTQSWKKAAFIHRAYNINDMAVKTADYNLIATKAGKYELYDRRKDPLNLYDVAAQQPEVVKQMQELLSAGWQGAVPEVE